MSDLISREAAIKALWKEPLYLDPLNVMAEARDRIEALPSIEAEPIKHGWWILNRQGNWACSLCGNDPYHSNMHNMNYCPNCGAKMSERREDEL